MKNITISELHSNTNEMINNVVMNDDFLEVETENGHAVIISGREWQMLRELLKITFNS